MGETGDIVDAPETVLALRRGRRLAVLRRVHRSGSTRAIASGGRRSRTGHRHGEGECGSLERDVLLLQALEQASEVFILNGDAKRLCLEFSDFLLELRMSAITSRRPM